MLTIGIPKGENFLESAAKLLGDAGFPVYRDKSDSLHVWSPCGTLHGYLLRTRRVPYLVKEGYLDLGITGEDILDERGKGDAVVLTPLVCERVGFKETRIALFGHMDDPVESAEEIPPGSSILSEYPRLTWRFFSPRSDLNIDVSPGGSEAEVRLAYRFGIAVVDTGRTLFANDLKEIFTLRTSRPVLIASKDALADTKKKAVIERLVSAIKRVLHYP